MILCDLFNFITFLDRWSLLSSFAITKMRKFRRLELTWQEELSHAENYLTRGSAALPSWRDMCRVCVAEFLLDICLIADAMDGHRMMQSRRPYVRESIGELFASRFSCLLMTPRLVRLCWRRRYMLSLESSVYIRMRIFEETLPSVHHGAKSRSLSARGTFLLMYDWDNLLNFGICFWGR